MSIQDTQANGELYGFALGKVARVLGPDSAKQLVDRLLGKLNIELRTPQDLMRLSEAMTALGGFEAAVGAMLGVDAILRGATAENPKGNAPTH